MPDRIQCANFLIEKGVQLESLQGGTLEESDCLVEDNIEDDVEMFNFADALWGDHLIQDDCNEANFL